MSAFAWATAGAAYLLLWAGGLVTSTGSSLAVPDWPLSFGQYFPAMVGGVLFEHGHRMIAGLVGLMTLAQTAWTLGRGEKGAARALSLAASAAILVQAGLGGATVLLRLPPSISIAHACLGQGVFCLLLAFAESQGRGSLSVAPEGALAFGAAYAQLFLGAFLRHTGEGLVWHALWAAGVLVLCGRLAVKGLRAAAPGLKTPSLLLAFLLPGQIVLGYLAYRWRFSPDFETGLHAGSALATAHVAVGAAILGSALLWTLRAPRRAAA